MSKVLHNVLKQRIRNICFFNNSPWMSKLLQLLPQNRSEY